MKFSLHFASNTFPDFAGAVRVAQAAEAAGFDSIFAIDHVVYPDAYTTPYPYAAGGRLPMTRSSAFPDPLIWIASVAAVTTRLRFMTGVLVLPQRDPMVLAKQVATLDAMSGGRFELGIGVGWLKEEFEALGVPFEQRGRRADEYIAAMRALWATDGASYAGRYVKFEGVSCNPKPVGHVPIIVGGHSEAAARRAGRVGDGFFPSIGAQVDTSPLFEVARRAASDEILLKPAAELAAAGLFASPADALVAAGLGSPAMPFPMPSEWLLPVLALAAGAAGAALSCFEPPAGIRAGFRAGPEPAIGPTGERLLDSEGNQVMTMVLGAGIDVEEKPPEGSDAASTMRVSWITFFPFFFSFQGGGVWWWKGKRKKNHSLFSSSLSLSSLFSQNAHFALFSLFSCHQSSGDPLGLLGRRGRGGGRARRRWGGGKGERLDVCFSS